jgi:hypothetical protein
MPMAQFKISRLSWFNREPSSSVFYLTHDPFRLPLAMFSISIIYIHPLQSLLKNFILYISFLSNNVL